MINSNIVYVYYFATYKELVPKFYSNSLNLSPFKGCPLRSGLAESHFLQDGGQDEDPPAAALSPDWPEAVKLLLQLLYPRPRHFIRRGDR